MLISLKNLFVIVIKLPNKGVYDALVIVSKKRSTDNRQLFDYEMYKSQREKRQ